MEGPEEVLEGGLGVERRGVDELLHRRVERVARHLLLFERKIAEVGARGDLPVREEARPAVIENDRTEGLESRLADDRLRREQEIPLPEPLDPDRPVGLGVDGQEQARALRGLGDPADDRQGVSVGVGVDRARFEGFPG